MQSVAAHLWKSTICALPNATVVITGSRKKVLTYVVLVFLIVAWAAVLLPPYLKDRRSTAGSFRRLPASNAANPQRFLPLQNAPTGYATSAVTSPTGMRTSPAARSVAGSNVVPLRPLSESAAPMPAGASTKAFLQQQPIPADEASLHAAWDTPTSTGIGVPTSTSAARERRRQILIALMGTSFITLLLAMFLRGNWIPVTAFINIALVGYVILLVRHRQVVADRLRKVEPIRPPVSEQTPSHVQLAPSYLLKSNTGS